MRTLIQIGKVAALFGAAFVFVTIGLVALEIRTATHQIEGHLTQLSVNLDAETKKLDALLTTSNKVAMNARLSLDNINKAAIDERFYFEKELPPLMASVNKSVNGLGEALSDSSTLLITTNERVADLKTSQAKADVILDDLHTTITDPAIRESIQHVDTATAELAETSKEADAAMGSVKAIAADAQAEVHSITHPKPLVSIANWTLKVVHALGGFF